MATRCRNVADERCLVLQTGILQSKVALVGRLVARLQLHDDSCNGLCLHGGGGCHLLSEVNLQF